MQEPLAQTRRHAREALEVRGRAGCTELCHVSERRPLATQSSSRSDWSDSAVCRAVALHLGDRAIASRPSSQSRNPTGRANSVGEAGLRGCSGTVRHRADTIRSGPHRLVAAIRAATAPLRRA